MKSEKLISAIALLVALSITVSLAAQEHKKEHHHYKLVDIGTFGGPESYVNPTPGIGSPHQVNRRGATVGGAGTSISTTTNSNPVICGGFDGIVPFVNHGLEWQNGVMTDLGSLAGANNCSVATSINATGEISGHSENGVIDPVLGFNELRAVRWKDGVIQDLGTLPGGSVSAGAGINRRGQVVGFALNGIPDPFSIYDFQLFGSSNGTQTRAFLWDRHNGMQDLGLLGTGNDAWGDFVNDQGQVAGFAYTDSTPNPVTGLPTTHPFLWEDGKGMTDLGSLGGTLAGSEPADFQGALNNHGQVTGVSTLAGDLIHHPFLWTMPGPMQDLGTLGGDCGQAFAINDAAEVVGLADVPGPCGQVFHAFLWKSDVMTDLGTVEGDTCSFAHAINSTGQIVGVSLACDYSVLHAVLWQDGQIIDLNTRIPPNSAFYLTRAFAINDRGEIAGVGVPPGCLFDDQCGHAFVLIPCDDGRADSGDCEEQPDGVTATAQSSSALVTQSPTMMTEGSSSTNDRTGTVRGRLGRRYPYRGVGTYQPR